MPDEPLSGAGAIGLATGWIEGTLLGTVATTVAVIAVAVVGVMMLTGRIDVRRAAQVVFGCFIIFGASTIARGILGATSGSASGELAGSAPPPQIPALAAPAPLSSAQVDSYAGAALPPRQ